MRRLAALQSPVFLVNSRLGLVSAAPPLGGAPLLPKLRGCFAEFLGRGCPVRLGMLCRPTCVGLRYGRAPVLRRARFSRAPSGTGSH